MSKAVLFVSSNKTLVMYMNILIRRMGFRVATAGNGLDALDIISAFHPDTIIIDSDLADFNGLDGLERIRAGGASIPPVILLVGALTEEAEIRCISAGASTVITKPVRAEELQQALEECMFMDQGLRRRYARIKMELPAAVRHKGALLALTVDSLSAGGAYIRHDDPLEVGAEVEIRIPLGEMGVLSTAGRVIYHEKPCRNQPGVCPGFAVKFVGMDTHKTKALMDYVTKLLTDDISGLQGDHDTASDPYSAIRSYAERTSALDSSTPRKDTADND